MTVVTCQQNQKQGIWNAGIRKCVAAVNARSLLAGSNMGFYALRQEGGLTAELRGIAWHCVFFDEVSASPCAVYTSEMHAASLVNTYACFQVNTL